jgi:hypothetical protein
MLNADKLLELIKYSEIPFRYHSTIGPIVIGKGFVAIEKEEGQLEIYLCTIGSLSNNKIEEHLIKTRVLIHPSFIKDLPKTVSNVIKKYIAEAGDLIDIIHTKNIFKYFGFVINYPTFVTLKQEKEYIISLLDDFFAKYEGVKSEEIEKKELPLSETAVITEENDFVHVALSQESL